MGTGELTKVLVAARHNKGAQRLRSGLQKLKSIHMLGEVADWKEAAKKIKDQSPDIVLLDGGIDKAEAIRNLRKTARDTKILVITSDSRAERIIEILQTGVHGCVMQNISPNELERAIESIMDGGAFLSPEVANVLLQEYLRTTAKLADRATPPLSEREKQVLVLIVDGRTNKEAATLLGLGVRTIETHRERLMRKLKVRNSAQLTKFAIENGLVD